MLDRLSTRYASFLDGAYDCVDRIVLNAYFQFGQAPAGFRLWWRSLRGSDEELDNAHLMRMAGRFARRVRAHAAAHQIPVVDCAAEERKHVVAEQYLPTDPDFVGVFVILVGRAPAPVWDVQQTKSGTIVNIQRKTQYVKHYYFHILDPDWGHVTIRMSGHPPFGAQVILNGHDYVACQARRAGLRFQKEDNCFTDVTDATHLAQLADTLRASDIVGPLRQVCERWLYTSCLCFALDSEEQTRSNFHYDYSVYQVEYSRNLLFQHGSQLEQLFQGLVDRTRSWLDVKRVQTIFGRKRRPYRHGQHRAQPRFEVVVERPVYDLTVFKLHFGLLTVKLYTKGERVLRSEAIVHNTKALHCGRALPKFPQVVTELAHILQRFLDALDCVDSAFIADDTFDQLTQPGCVGQTRVAGVDLSNPRMRAVIQAILALAAAPKGFLVATVAAKVREIRGLTPEAYRARHAAYDLRKLRGKQWVRIIDKSRSYEVVPEGLQAMTAILVLRDKVIKPVLAATAKPIQTDPPERLTPLDALYRTLQGDMCQLFQLLGIAVQTA
ncbi:MAG: hypothetical protein BWY52_01236 [Chloroflexi bacterium ADurb.Bin325]|nr:MAG: hypothetical protein BWY52_01236 [Chloroflexi bacterium ADurb.Bin325]